MAEAGCGGMFHEPAPRVSGSGSTMHAGRNQPERDRGRYQESGLENRVRPELPDKRGGEACHLPLVRAASAAPELW